MFLVSPPEKYVDMIKSEIGQPLIRVCKTCCLGGYVECTVERLGDRSVDSDRVDIFRLGTFRPDQYFDIRWGIGHFLLP